MKFSYILPVCNQADHITAIVEEYHLALTSAQIDFEFLLVVNGSSDTSLDVCQTLSRKIDRVRVLEIKRAGWGNAVKFGIQEASGDMICYTNTARTDVKDLVLLTTYSIAYPETIVKAERKKRNSSIRRAGSTLYNLELRLLFGLTHWDCNGTPKLFHRKHVKLFELKSDDDLLDAEFMATIRRENYPIIAIPINESPRHGGRSTTDLLSAVRMYSGALTLWRRLLRS